MNSLILIIISFIGYFIAYKTYGKYLSQKIFNVRKENRVPAYELMDGVDFVPTKKRILFGHHFTTIAGLGPIVGPAIGIIWGWLPAFIWVFFGSILMGAMHDFSSLIISSRHQGKTMGELTGSIISPTTRRAFQIIMQFLLWIVLGVFAMIVGVLFVQYPEAVFPVWFQIPIAIILGKVMHKGKHTLAYSIVATIMMYASIFMGIWWPISLPPIMGSSVVTWSILLFIYVYFASIIPVQKLLQPRDYINSHQLMIAMGLIILGIIVAHPVITAPAINNQAFKADSDVPSMLPLLFITIACGAVSGFHSLASSGTTVKQLNNETDAKFIGFGGMLWESFLAVLVLMCIAGGLGMGLEDGGQIFKGQEAYYHHYTSWAAASGLTAKLNAFITGAANLMSSYGIPLKYGKAMIAVFIVSFANTTLDSCARIQRLSVQELFRKDNGLIRKPWQNRYFSTLIIVVAAASLTFIKEGAQGALILWPLFGALNQLLAALALGIITLYLIQTKKPYWIALIPMMFILSMTCWSMVESIESFWKSKDWLLMNLSLIILGLTAWLIIAGVTSLTEKK